MKSFLDRSLRFNPEPPLKNLDKWVINEVDAEGKPIKGDWGLWPWTLHFQATSARVVTSTAYRPNVSQDRDQVPTTVHQGDVIICTLKPYEDERRSDWDRATRYSLFGTSRIIKDFYLHIYPVSENDGVEACTAYGVVSYEMEIDFRTRVEPDVLGFYFYVDPERYKLYRSNLLEGNFEEIYFYCHAAGFYAEWTPEIHAPHIKILTAGNDQKIELPSEIPASLARLGLTSDATLSFNRLITLNGEKAKGREPESASVSHPPVPEPVVMPTPVQQRPSPRWQQVLWVVVGALAMFGVMSLFRR